MTQPTPPSPSSPETPTPSAIPFPSPASIPASRLVTVHGVQWSRVFDFIELFRGFRLAINPAKLTLALLAILMIYAAGRLFDGVWGPQVYHGELSDFATQRGDLSALRARELENRTDNLDRLLRAAAPRDDSLTPDRIDLLKDHPAAAFRALKKSYRTRFDQDLKDIHDRRLAAERVANESDPALRISMGSASPAAVERDERAREAARLLDNVQTAHDTAGRGIFDTFMQFEIAQFGQLVDNSLGLIRVTPLRPASANSETSPPPPSAAISSGLISTDPERLWRSDTVAGCLTNMAVVAPRWLFTGTAPMQWRPENADTWGGWIKMICYRGLYLACVVMLALFALILLAFTGASICRLSALELAGEERIPLKNIFVFAARRLWVFIKAPIAPFLILLVIGLVMTLGGLLGAIPFVGEIVLGIFFIVFLGIAFILMLLLLGILGGFNLLYPTIAVEGSDAFDAMSRSFAYVYARPWRLLFYTVVSLIYGVLTFLFISLAVYLILLLTHTFVGWGTSFFGMNHGWYSGALKLDTLWPAPSYLHLVSPINWYAMSWSEYIGALFLHFWVFLLIAVIGAYVISYYFCSHTILYLLLRRSVDGQSTREVYQELPPPAPAPIVPEPPTAPSATPPSTAPTPAVTEAAVPPALSPLATPDMPPPDTAA